MSAPGPVGVEAAGRRACVTPQTCAWCSTVDEVARAQGTDPATGLEPAEAARRLATVGPNAISTERRPSLLRLVTAQLRDAMIVVLLAAFVLTLVTGDLADAVVILLVVTVNTTVGAMQERRALGAVDALRSMAAPSATLRRGGRLAHLPAAEVVPGDVLVLAEGDVVAADARLLTANDLEVDESLLTGESLPSARDVRPVSDPAAAVADRRCMVHGGTLVLHGTGTAVVVATGESSAIGGIARLLHSARIPMTPLQRRLARLGGALSAIALAGCALVAVLGLLRGQPWELVLVTGISLAVAAVPESLPAVVTLSLAAGAHRMARRGAIVRTLGAVETLGSVTVLACDKTGTLTSGEMDVVATWTPSGGERGVDGPPAGPALEAVLAGGSPQEDALLSAAVLCSDADVQAVAGGPTERALVRGALRAELDIDAVRAAFPRTGEVPFDRDRRSMSTSHDGSAGPFTITKGAPETVLRLGGAPAGSDARTALEIAATWAAGGRRVIAVAVSAGAGGPRLLGLVAIADPVRPDAPAAIRSCRDAGITTVLITGDHPGTADAVARATGIIGPAMPRSAVVDPVVYARADPATKLRLIAAWQEGGQVVAMTGDGVNDAPALRAADIGVAMGRRGTDVARAAADVVLTDDSLATIVAAVAEGRRVYDNIRRFVRYGLAGGAAEIAVMLLGPLLGFPLPLLAGQILWVNLLTHGLPGVAIGAEQAEPHVLRRPPRPPDEPILTRELVAQTLLFGAALTAGCLWAAARTRAAGGPWQSVLFATLAVGQLGLALTTRSDSRACWRIPLRTNRLLAGAVAGSAVLVLAALYLPPLQVLLRTAALSPADLATVLAAAVFPAVVAQVLVLVRRRRPSGGRPDRSRDEGHRPRGGRHAGSPDPAGGRG